MKDRYNRWYLRSWQRVEKENGKGYDFVYMGELYGYTRPAAQVKTMKALLLAGCILLLAVYLLSAIVVSPGALWRWTALPQILTLLPLIYLVMAVVRVLLNGEKVPYRDYHAGPLRLKKALNGVVVLLGLTFVSDAVFTVLYAENVGRELLFMAELAVCIALCAAGLAAVKRFPCVIVESPKEAETTKEV